MKFRAPLQEIYLRDLFKWRRSLSNRVNNKKKLYFRGKIFDLKIFLDVFTSKRKKIK